MKKNNLYPLSFFFAISFLLVFVLFSSCHRNKDCDLVINVVDGNIGGPVVGATVHVYPPPSTSGTLKIQDQTSTTDASGVATFTFKLPALLQADITPPSPYLNASKLVKLEEGRSVTQSIKVY